MKNADQLRKKIAKDDDFIYCPRLGNSLNKLLEKNPDGVDDKRMSKLLLMTEEEIEQTYQSAIGKIKKLIGL